MRLLILLIGLTVTIPALSATWNIRFPRPMSDTDSRHDYPLQLLEKALEKTGVNYHLAPTDKILLQSKALQQLQGNRDVSVVWSMTNEQREQDLLPIRIPVYKGLIGLRIALVRKADRDVFKYVRSMKKLNLFSPLSGRDWPDTKILQANGFAVETDENYEGLFDQLAAGQADFLPRSVVEIWAETGKGNELITEPHIALYYPTAVYFFVNKKNQTLARLIESGLEKLIASGEFEQLFLDAHQQSLAKADLATRRIFRLDNPNLPVATPLDREALWHQPTTSVE
ncbi:transporter substrate-binding domain-containing protein [Lacimicrobium alkaliphilum]|uniref:Solute-binding protein family 3/N-terminal domain-containing protein n=1 Tax=Lacimicrobium alkaliphilum TaxID=1526571 RepID=A0ABQ1RQA8_9ALTE|nr:transporter substrate-binding domain-containing protein [Lacimicrobium alkaliphilum]GGD75893.1 hypothetical protein GCM10011357_33620 [Lacimicrobium alkaliphilum]